VPAVGIDLGGTKILAGLIDDHGHLVRSHKLPTPRTGVEAVLAAVVAAVSEVAEGDEPVGVGVPGMVEDDGTVTRAPNLVGFERPVPVADELRRRLGRPVAVDNDVNVGAIAEHRLGAGRGWHELVAVFVGTGVGGGVILDGHLRRGPGGAAGEIGHLTVHPGGEPCACGGRGHLEAYAGRAGLERRAREAHARGRATLLVDQAGDAPMKSKVVSKALADGDELAHELVADAADALAIAIGNTAALLDVHRFVVGGGLGERLGRPFLDQVLGSDHFGGFGPASVELRLAERLDDAGVVGAAMLALGPIGPPARGAAVDAG
jgi:glucokinase